MNRNRKFVRIFSLIAAICFGIVSYVHFFRNRVELGGLFALLTIAQLVLACINYRVGKKKEDNKNESEL